MKLNENSKIVEFGVYVEAYHSGAIAYGTLYVPKEVLDNYEDPKDDLVTYIYELDGKHSETRAEIQKAEGTLGEFVGKGHPDISIQEDMDETLEEEVGMFYEFEHDDIVRIQKLNDKMEELMEASTNTVELSEDLIIEGILVSKGSEVTYTTRDTQSNINIEL